MLKSLFKNYWLLLLILIGSYAPFLNFRLIRGSGDEKVYIAQAFEMQAHGNWFLQVLAGEASYFKGPLHYILIRLGLILFDHSLWAALYMNLIFALLGAVALAELVRDAFPEKKHWPLWAGAFFGLNVGVFGHLYTSQMEVELAGIFSLAFYFLWKSVPKAESQQTIKPDLAFWLLAGIVGWVKSPLHSALLGASGVLFWTVTGKLWLRIKDIRFGLCASAGILLCLVGYMPAFFLDYKAFFEKYVLWENYYKRNGNGGPWWQAVVPMFSYYLIPCMTIAFVSYGEFLVSIFRNGLGVFKRNRILLFSLSGILPTMAFFIYHPYRGENYAMPVTASIICLILYFFASAEAGFDTGTSLDGKKQFKVRNGLAGVISFLPILLPVALTVFCWRVPVPAWFSPWLLPVIWGLILCSVALQLWEHFVRKSDGLGIYGVLGNSCIMLSLSFLLLVLGEMEVIQVKDKIAKDRSRGIQYRVSYWNLNHLIWNEWGLMSLAIHHPITPLLNDADLLRAIREGDLILIRDDEHTAGILEIAKKNFPDIKHELLDWHRWKTHAADGAGNSLIGTVWREKDISRLYDHAHCIRFLKDAG